MNIGDVWLLVLIFGALIAMGLIFEAMLAVLTLAVTLPVWGARRLWRRFAR